MIITENYTKDEVKIINIIKAEWLNDYVIHFAFDDDKETQIDFYPFLKDSKNEMAKKYLDKNLFQDFSLKFGDIVWNDYEMCFPIWDLYSGKI